MILAAPDRLAAAFYKFHRGDTYFAARALTNVLSAAGVVAFAGLALAVFRRPWPAAAAALLYAGTFGAYSRSWGNFLREDFAMPGLLLATAAALYLLASREGKRRWPVAAGAAAATLAACSCWHLSQFYVALLGLFVVGYALAGRGREAAWAGGALWLGLALAAVINKPLWVKGALWGGSSALAAAPVLGWALGRLLGRPGKARWVTAACVLVLVALALAFGRSAAYGHVYGLIWAKVIHLGRYPGPAALSPDARLFWVGPYKSPAPLVVFFEYGPLALTAALGLALWWYAAIKKRLAAGAFVALAAPLFAILYLLIMRLTIFLAPWVAILGVYPLGAIKGTKGRMAYGAALALLLAFHVYTANVKNQPPWFQEAVNSVLPAEKFIPWYYGSERVELMLWLAAQPRPSPVLADFSLSPPFLYLAGQPTALNPMFEVPEVRAKALAYAEAATADEETFYRLCRRWRVKYVAHFAPQVLSRETGSFYNVTAREPGPASAAALMQFSPAKLRRFRLLLETYNARVFEVGRPYDGYVSPAYHPLYDPALFPAVPDEEPLREFYRSRERADYFYRMGCAYQEQGEFVGAAAAFNNALCLHPDYEDATLRLGYANLQLGRSDDARRALERAALTRPHDPRAAAYLKMLPRK
jgi:tetratricopeptide (TPR) repeat protein